MNLLDFRDVYERNRQYDGSRNTREGWAQLFKELAADPVHGVRFRIYSRLLVINNIYGSTH